MKERVSSERRPSSGHTFMEIAEVWARRSTCSDRIAVGAVLVNKMGQVIASGYNGAPRGMPHCDDVGCDLDSDHHCMRAIHAEENVILQCAINGTPSKGCTLYVTHSPCPRCALRIIQAGIIRVLYEHEYKGFEGTIKILYSAGISMTRLP